MKQTNPFAITISRQLGSGGSSIGQQLAKKMNIFFADREIISKAAEQLSVLENDLESREEKLLSFWDSLFKVYTVAPDVYVTPHLTSPTDRELYETQAEVIKHIVEEHSAIIIGRCGFHVLREYPNLISIFLHADMDFRNKRVQNMYHISKDLAQKMIDQSDNDTAN